MGNHWVVQRVAVLGDVADTLASVGARGERTAMPYCHEFAFQVLAQAASGVEDPGFHRGYGQTKMSSGLFAGETTEFTEHNHSSEILPQP